jgi:hypothetical protein
MDGARSRKGQSEHKQGEHSPAAKAQRDALEPQRPQPSVLGVQGPTAPYTELPEASRASPLYHEWSFYRREAGRLLAEGHEGRFVIIKGEQLIGIWDTQQEAKAVALQRYLMQPCLIHQVRRFEPLVRLSPRLQQCQG